MGGILSGRFLLVVLGLAALAPANARADLFLPSGVLVANVSTVGAIGLGYTTVAGAKVQFYERVGNRLKPLGAAPALPTVPPVAGISEAARWRCDRLVRRFEAIAVAPDGSSSQDSYDLRTPSCATRFRLSVPRRVALGETARVLVKDRWTNGKIKPRLCITPPHAAKACRVLALAPAVDIADRRFRANRRGVWRVELQIQGHRERRAVAVGGVRAVSSKPRPNVLATGDSTMGGLEGFIGDRLANTATVSSGVFPGSGISRDHEWLTRAAVQAKRYRPRTTVVSLGDLGYAMQTPNGATRECCGAPWVAEYTRRVRLMMETYIRHGHGHVLWLTVPIPSAPQTAALTRLINEAFLRAANGLAGVQILRLDQLFTPNGYQEYLTYRGQAVRVRQSDGLHLTVAGNAIAAKTIEEALRRLRWPGGGS